MTKALIVYNSKHGTTKKFSQNISSYLTEKGSETQIVSVEDFNDSMAADKDIVLLGAWTHGLMIVLQHPDKPFVNFAKNAPVMNGKKVALFTTYKLATGSMFKKMKLAIGDKIDAVSCELKSKNGELKDDIKNQLDLLLN